MKITLLKPGDETLLIEVAKLLNDFDVSIERAAELLADPSFFLIAALTDTGAMMGRIYGHLIPRFDQTDLLIYEVDVMEEYHRKGVGKAMMEFVKQFASKRGYREMWVLTEGENKPARALYESTGGVEESSPTIMYVFYL